MSRKESLPRSAGFTLLELIIVIAIISVIAAMMIPSLIKALEKGKQKRTLSDMRNAGVAWVSWLSDQVQASAAGQVANPDWPFGISNPAYPHADLQAALEGSQQLPSGDASPEYLKRVPQRDGWGNHYVFALNEDNLLGESVIAIYSAARDGSIGNAITTCDDDDIPRPGNHGYFDARRFDCDIVWKDGFFVQAPSGAQALTGSP